MFTPMYKRYCLLMLGVLSACFLACGLFFLLPATRDLLNPVFLGPSGYLGLSSAFTFLAGLALSGRLEEYVWGFREQRPARPSGLLAILVILSLNFMIRMVAADMEVPYHELKELVYFVITPGVCLFVFFYDVVGRGRAHRAPPAAKQAERQSSESPQPLQ